MVLDEVMLNEYRKKRGSRCSVQKNYIEIQGSKCQKKKKKRHDYMKIIFGKERKGVF